MTVISCESCDKEQDVKITTDTYSIKCKYCNDYFEVPRKFRGGRKSSLEEKSAVNIRLGFTVYEKTMTVGWTVQSAEKYNKYLERNSVSVDISNTPEKLHWYIAVFKTLQNINDYKSARIWIKDDRFVNHLENDDLISDDDLRTSMRNKIISLSEDKFLGCEFGRNGSIGGDIRKMINK